MQSESTFDNLRDSFIRLLERGVEDLQAAAELEATGARHFKALVDSGDIRGWPHPFPCGVRFEDPRIIREKWSMSWGIIYGCMREQHRERLPDRMVVREHKVFDGGSITESVPHWRLRVEGDAALCALLTDILREDTSRPPTVPPRGPFEPSFFMSQICEMTGTGTDSIRKYAKYANVEPTPRGKRNRRFTENETRRILEAFVSRCCIAQTREKCNSALSKVSHKDQK